MEFLKILIKINITLLMFYIMYRLLLRNLTFYNFNRFYLLSAIIVSLFIPFIQYNTAVRHEILNWQEIIGYDASMMNSAWTWDYETIISAIYWAGVIIMGILFIIQLFSLLLLYRRTKRKTVLGYSIRILKENSQPFSFFKTIFINPNQHNQEELFSILQHETIHSRQWHSADVILGELKRIFCWFNPAAWLMLSAIRENLEFIADRQVLESGMDPAEYQYTLLATQQSIAHNSLSNHFNFSHLKLRITMMNKKKTSELHLLKYLLAAPIVATTLLLTNYVQANESNAELISIKNEHTEDNNITPSHTSSSEDKQLLQGFMNAAAELYNKNHDDTITKTFKVSFVAFKDEENSLPDYNPPFLNLHDKIGTGQPITLKLNSEKGSFINQEGEVVYFNEPQTWTARIDEGSNVSFNTVNQDKAIFIVDGKETEEISSLPPNDIENIVVLKDAKAKSLYPHISEGQGVILITTKNSPIQPIKKGNREINIYPNPANSILNITVKSDGLNNTYRIYNKEGALKLSGKLQSHTKVDIQALDNGVYFLKMNIGGSEESSKFEIIK